MKTYKVSELLETSYLYSTTCKDLEYLLSQSVQALKSGQPFHTPSLLQDQFVQDVLSEKHIPPLDIAGMHLTDGAAQLISTYQIHHGIKFVDTADKGRNNVLEANEQYANSSKYTCTPLPEISIHTDFVKWVYSLDPGRVYQLNVTSETAKIYYALTALTIEVRPDIRFDFSNSYGISFLKWVHSLLSMDKCMEFTDFYYISEHSSKPYLDVAHFDYMHKRIETPELLHMDYNRAWTTLYLVPTVFGNGHLNDNDPTGIFTKLGECISAYIQEYYNNAPRDLYELLKRISVKENN